MEQEYQEARSARDECLEQQKQGEVQSKHSTVLQVHPLLEAAVAETKKEVVVSEESKLPMRVKHHDDETKSISALIEKLPSPYE